MPAPHRGVEHLELEDLERLRVVLRAAFLDLRPERLLHQEPHERMRRVIRAARLPSQPDSQVEPVRRESPRSSATLVFLPRPFASSSSSASISSSSVFVVLGRLFVDGPGGAVLLALEPAGRPLRASAGAAGTSARLRFRARARAGPRRPAPGLRRRASRSAPAPGCRCRVSSVSRASDRAARRRPARPRHAPSRWASRPGRTACPPAA